MRPLRAEVEVGFHLWLNGGQKHPTKNSFLYHLLSLVTVQDAMIESVRPECLALSGLDTREAGPRMQVSQPSRTKAPLLKYQTSKDRLLEFMWHIKC